ncbi:hypothetical protein [Gordonia sihwensis]|uniref:hypothetical protein n=1 Tax=Gordonia sihwensis TaxID=173559 RepID=UPI003D98B4EA
MTESAARILLETDGIEILWDAGVHPRHVVAWWESVGRPDGRVSVYDLLAHMASRDEFPTLVHTGPQPRAVPDLLTDGFVVPGVVRSLVGDPAFIEQCARIVAAPRPDHSPASTVPGCTLLVPEVEPPARLFIDRSRPGQQAAARNGTRQASSDVVDGVRLVAVRRAHDREPSLLLFAVSDAVEVPRNPVDDADPLYRLSRDLLEAAFGETRNARLRRLNRFAEWMHEAGEYAEAVIWLLDTYRRQPANPWSVSQLMTVFAMVLRGCLPTRDTPRVLETVGRLLTRDAPEIWGLPTHFGECELLETEPVADLVDLDLLHSRTEVWMRSIFREMHPHDDGAALAASVTVDRREHDIQCAWGPTVVAFAYRRSGTADPTWIAESPPSARAHLIHAALLLAFNEVTGVPTPLPPVPADYSDTAARSAFIRELFDVRALRRLSSVRGTHF